MKLTLFLSARSALVLGGFALVAGGLLAATHWATRDRIAQAQQQRLLLQLNELVPAQRYDNDLARDTREVTDARLGTSQPVTVYRARRAGAPVAAIFRAVAPDGYSGPIELLVGVQADGRLAGVRVLAHRETPGLGDKIDLAHGDWILAFAGLALGDPPPPRWAVRKDGGDFDQFSGATITPRAVVKAVRRALEYFDAERDALFAPTSPS